MTVSDKTYTNLSNLTEDQREIVIEMYQQWLDESGLKQGTVFNDDLEVVGWMAYLHIYKASDGGYKLFVDEDDDLSNKQEVTYEEIAQHAFGFPIDSRIEYWYKVCDLIDKYAADSDFLDLGSEDTSIGDAALEILEEGLKLRQNKRKQEIEDAAYQAKKTEEEIVKRIIDQWKWKFDDLGFSIWFNELEKVFEITSDTGDFKNYKVSSELGIERIHEALDSLDDYL